MKDEIRLQQHLGYRILRWVLSIALISGTLLSATQIITDANRVSDDLDQFANQTLTLVQDAATQAVFSIDRDLGTQVLEGLLRQESVTEASITHPDGELLATAAKEPARFGYRTLTDPIFGSQREYQAPLTRLNAQGQGAVYGVLRVQYDTAHIAGAWLNRAAFTFGSSLAQALVLALVLYLVYYFLLNRPLGTIIRALREVDPEHPEDHPLSTPRGHERDELGLWVRATNALLRAIAHSQSQHRAAEERATRLSRYDQLTGLPSRETLLDTLAKTIDSSDHRDRRLALFCCGIDDFKSINDQTGYQTGDRILQALAERLEDQREEQHLTVGRLGSDQFLIIASHLKDDYQAAATAEWLLRNYSQPLELPGGTVRVTVTIGIALYPTDAADADRLLQHAEHTMTLAKASAGNQFRFYIASVDQEIRERKQLERDLSGALARDQFHLVYQPQVSLQSQRIIGAEALLRWTHPEHGLIPPDHFIPLAELNGSIVSIGAWVLDEACRQAAQWARDGVPLRMAVNLSAIQLRQADIVSQTLATLERHRIPPGRLELEVTETGFMENLEDAVIKLQQLNDAGISIAVDDFGTGYSSLTYLKRMPVQHLKIDKQFIQDLLLNEDDTRIANTIIDLGRSLNLSVIAEGVETEEQEYYLRQRGCQIAQGYYFSRPLLAADFAGFVADFHRGYAENEDNLRITPDA